MHAVVVQHETLKGLLQSINIDQRHHEDHIGAMSEFEYTCEIVEEIRLR